MTVATVNGVRTRLDQLDAILQGSHFGYEEMTTVLNAVPDLVRTVRAILDLAETLDEESLAWDLKRKSGPNGSDYTSGASHALNRAAIGIRSGISVSYR